MRIIRLQKNQFILRDSVRSALQSYDKIIVSKKNGKVYLDKLYWDYSKTTRKYRNIFLSETKKETEKKIKSGEYKLINLNR